MYFSIRRIGTSSKFLRPLFFFFEIDFLIALRYRFYETNGMFGWFRLQK